MTNKRYTQSFVYVNQVLFKVLQMLLNINSSSVFLNSECFALSLLSSSSLTSFSLRLSLINISSKSFGKSSLIYHMFAFWSYPWSAIFRSSKLASKHLFQIPAKEFALLLCTTGQQGQSVEISTNAEISVNAWNLIKELISSSKIILLSVVFYILSMAIDYVNSFFIFVKMSLGNK